MDGFRRRAKNKFGHSGWIMEFDAVSKKQYIFNHLSQSLSSSPPPGAATAAAGAAAAPSAAAPAAAVRPAKRKQKPRLTLPLSDAAIEWALMIAVTMHQPLVKVREFPIQRGKPEFVE